MNRLDRLEKAVKRSAHRSGYQGVIFVNLTPDGWYIRVNGEPDSDAGPFDAMEKAVIVADQIAEQHPYIDTEIFIDDMDQ